MLPQLPLSEMTVEEKLQTMEFLWESLSTDNQQIESPSWHGETLAEREAALKNGDAHFEDWESAKKEIRDQLP